MQPTIALLRNSVAISAGNDDWVLKSSSIRSGISEFIFPRVAEGEESVRWESCLRGCFLRCSGTRKLGSSFSASTMPGKPPFSVRIWRFRALHFCWLAFCEGFDLLFLLLLLKSCFCRSASDGGSGLDYTEWVIASSASDFLHYFEAMVIFRIALLEYCTMWHIEGECMNVELGWLKLFSLWAIVILAYCLLLSLYFWYCLLRFRVPCFVLKAPIWIEGFV